MTTKESLTQIGKTLVEDNGKQEHYTSEQVQNAINKINTSDIIDGISLTAEAIDFAMSLYSPVEEFIKYFSSNAAQYLELKTKALKEISESDWDVFPTIDIDMSWLDAGDLLEGAVEGIGSFLSAIFEGLS